MGRGNGPDDDEPPRLTGADPHERASAIVELARRRAAGASSAIEPYATDKSPLVRGAVAFARARLLQGPADLTPLVDLLLSSHEDEVAFALEALGSLGDSSIPTLAARATADREGRDHFLRALSELGTSASRAALAVMARSTDTDLARQASALQSKI